jgi:hypothetical protein
VQLCWSTGPAVRDLPAAQVKPIAAVLLHWSGDAGHTCSAGENTAVVLLHWSDGVGPTGSAGENYCSCAAPLVRRCGTNLQYRRRDGAVA